MQGMANHAGQQANAMLDNSENLIRILRIGHDTSIRGMGISLHDAIRRSRYKDLRAGFGPQDLRPFLTSHRDMLEVWFAYSEDKRTDGGWYITRSGVLGRLGDPSSRVHFGSLEDAVAEYVVRELDFWANLSNGR
jgi:hypothetical protein